MSTFAISITISITIDIAIITDVTNPIKVTIFMVLGEVKETQLLPSFILTQDLSCPELTAIFSDNEKLLSKISYNSFGDEFRNRLG